MTQQDDITQRVLTDDEINDVCDWPAANTTMRAENDRAMAREVEAAVLRKLSKLRAPVADERAALEKWMVVDGDMRDPEGLITYHAAAFREGVAVGRAALASAPTSKPWPVEEQPDGTVTPVDPADMASAPVADVDLLSDALYYLKGNLPDGPVDHAHKAAVIARIESRLASAPVAGEAQPVADAAIKAAYVEHFGHEAGWLGYKGSWFIEGYRAGRNAAPQASECECSRKSKAVSDSEAQL